MNKYIKYLIIGVLLGGVGTLFYNKVYIPKTTYQIITPKMGDLTQSIRGIGNVGAKNIYAITAQTGGKIMAINTDVGEWVKKGDLLIVMDGVDLPQQLEVAKATLQKSKYDIKASEDELTNLQVQKKLLEITFDRYATLKEQKFASQVEYDKAKADLDGINANIKATKSRINSVKAGLNVAKKNIDAIKVKLSRLNVIAPIDGYVIEKNAQVAQNVLPSTPILKVVDVQTLWVETKIDERISANIQLKDSATITLRSQPNKYYKGSVKRINAISDAVTLEREIDVAFDVTPFPFYINEQAEVNIELKKVQNVLKIPNEVVMQNRGKLGVWIVKEEHIYFKEIEVIAQNDEEVAVKNLHKKTQIIVPNTKKKPLKEGMKIHL